MYIKPCKWMFSENSGFSSQIIHFNEVFFHDFHRPFFGFFPPIFSETPKIMGISTTNHLPQLVSLPPRIFWLMPSTPRTNQEVAIKVYKATPDRKVEANKLDPTLRIQVSPKEGISPIILFWGWDWNPQSYSREVSGFLGQSHRNLFRKKNARQAPKDPHKGEDVRLQKFRRRES